MMLRLCSSTPARALQRAACTLARAPSLSSPVAARNLRPVCAPAAAVHPLSHSPLPTLLSEPHAATHRSSPGCCPSIVVPSAGVCAYTRAATPPAGASRVASFALAAFSSSHSPNEGDHCVASDVAESERDRETKDREMKEEEGEIGVVEFEIKEVERKIEEVEGKIEGVELEIKKVELEIKEVERKIEEEPLDGPMWRYWVQEKDRLAQEKHDLRQKEQGLWQEKHDLRQEKQQKEDRLAREKDRLREKKSKRNSLVFDKELPSKDPNKLADWLFELAKFSGIEEKDLRTLLPDGLGLMPPHRLSKCFTDELWRRDQAVAAAKKYLANLPHSSGRRGFLATAAAPGVGKSRFLEHIGDTSAALALKGELELANGYDAVVPLPVGFNFGTSLCDIENERKKPGQCVAVRLAFALVCCNENKFFRFCEHFYALETLPGAVDIIEAACALARRVEGCTKPLVLVLGDEFKLCPDTTRAMKCITQCLTTSFDAAFIVTSLDGIFIDQFSEFTASMRPISWAHLGPIGDVDFLTKYLASVNNEINVEYCRALAALTAGHARSIEQVVEIIKKGESCKNPDEWGLLCSEVRERFTDAMFRVRPKEQRLARMVLDQFGLACQLPLFEGLTTSDGKEVSISHCIGLGWFLNDRSEETVMPIVSPVFASKCVTMLESKERVCIQALLRVAFYSDANGRKIEEFASCWLTFIGGVLHRAYPGKPICVAAPKEDDGDPRPLFRTPDVFGANKGLSFQPTNVALRVVRIEDVRPEDVREKDVVFQPVTGSHPAFDSALFSRDDEGNNVAVLVQVKSTLSNALLHISDFKGKHKDIFATLDNTYKEEGGEYKFGGVRVVAKNVAFVVVANKSPAGRGYSRLSDMKWKGALAVVPRDRLIETVGPSLAMAAELLLNPTSG